MIRITQEESVNYRRLDPERDFRYGMGSAVAFTVEPYDNYWESVEYYGPGLQDPTGTTLKPQWVYVLVNPSLPGICKIGYTTTSVAQRVAELTAQTASISPWYSVYSYRCPDGKLLEKEVHQYLEDRGVRVNHKREGFYIASGEAAKIVEELGQKYQTA